MIYRDKKKYINSCSCSDCDNGPASFFLFFIQNSACNRLRESEVNDCLSYEKHMHMSINTCIYIKNSIIFGNATMHYSCIILDFLFLSNVKHFSTFDSFCSVWFIKIVGMTFAFRTFRMWMLQWNSYWLATKILKYVYKFENDWYIGTDFLCISYSYLFIFLHIQSRLLDSFLYKCILIVLKKYIY